MSPGTYTIRHMRRKDRKMQRKRLRVGQPDVKRRRLELKAERQSKNASQSVLEGTCFFIGMLQDWKSLWCICTLESNLFILFFQRRHISGKHLPGVGRKHWFKWHSTKFPCRTPTHISIGVFWFGNWRIRFVKFAFSVWFIKRDNCE